MNGVEPNAPLVNRTFDELSIGETASLRRLVNPDDIKLFAAVSGDVNPAHLDAQYAAGDIFGHVVIHGMWTGALISTLLGTQLPGPGTIYLGQDLRFRKPVSPGDTITATVSVQEKRADKRIVLFDTRCTNQDGQEVLTGTATVIAPAEKLSLRRMAVPEVELRRHAGFERFLREASDTPPIFRCRQPSRRIFTKSSRRPLAGWEAISRSTRLPRWGTGSSMVAIGSQAPQLSPTKPSPLWKPWCPWRRFTSRRACG